MDRPEHLGSIEEHLHLNNVVGSILKAFCKHPNVQKASAPVLFHPDLHKRNVFVCDDYPTQITAIIDWQSCSIEPGLLHSDQTPDLCLFPRGKDPAHLATEKAGDDQSLEARQLAKDVDLCRKTWEVCMIGFMPSLFAGRVLDEDLVRIFHYAHGIWRHGSTAIRDDLIAIHRRWKDELNMSGECPYQPSQEELGRHPELKQAVVHQRKFEARLMPSLGVGLDGWVPINRWPEVERVCKALYAEHIQLVRGDAEAEEQAQREWPWDVR